MIRNSLSFLALAVTAMLSIDAAAQRPENADRWSFSVGAGLILAPSYLGDDAYQLSAVPNIKVTYGDNFSASIDGVGYTAIDSRGWRAGALVGYDFGRDEDGKSPFVIAGDETDDLDGLGDVDGTIEIGGFVEYDSRPFTTRVELRQGVNGHEGLIGEVEVTYGGRLVVADQMMIFSLGPNITLVDDDYNDSFFGVDADQSARSGLDEFDADGGLLSYGIGGSLIIPFDDHVSTVMIARYERLAGDAADSSLVEERGSENQGTVGLFLSYEF